MAKGLNNSELVIRRMIPDDISLGMKLKSFAGWNQVEEDWEMFLGAGGENFVVSLNGQDVGTVTSVPFQNHFSWIGMVLVDPSARRKGVGTALLNKSIEVSLQKGPVRLDATADGYELYKTLGFIREYELVRMVRRSRPFERETIASCCRLSIDDLPDVIKYDATIFGANRRFILNSFFNRNPEYAINYSGEESIEGYCLGRSGSHYEQIGPVLAESEAIARDLIITALNKCSTSDVVVDAFVDKSDWISFLEDIGFTRQRTFIRMCLGDLKYPGITDKQFVIAGPEIG